MACEEEEADEVCEEEEEEEDRQGTFHVSPLLTFGGKGSAQGLFDFMCEGGPSGGLCVTGGATPTLLIADGNNDRVQEVRAAAFTFWWL